MVLAAWETLCEWKPCSTVNWERSPSVETVGTDSSSCHRLFYCAPCIVLVGTLLKCPQPSFNIKHVITSVGCVFEKWSYWLKGHRGGTWRTHWRRWPLGRSWRMARGRRETKGCQRGDFLKTSTFSFLLFSPGLPTVLIHPEDFLVIGGSSQSWRDAWLLT